MIFITAAGRLGNDSELRYTAKGDAVLGFSLASDVGYGDKKHTVWVRCSLWGKRGESLAPHLLKGTSVTVVGNGDLREWESNGKSGTSLECRVSELTFSGSKQEQQQGFRDTPPAREAPAKENTDDFDDSSIPF